MTRRHPPERLTLDAILPHLQRVQKLPNGRYMFSCPLPNHGKGRGDIHPSAQLRVNPDGTLKEVKCFAHCDERELWRKLLELAGIQPATARPTRRLTVAEYARAKGLDAEKLSAWGLTDLQDGGVAIPYRNADGKQHAVRYRLALSADRFRWRQGDTPILYGLWQLPEWSDADTIYLCEGETDTLTLWHAGLPALGIPGAGVWKAEWWREVERFARIVVIPDNDAAGAGLVQRLAQTCPESIQERVQVLQLPSSVKDANELWLQLDADPERFREALAQCEMILLTDSYRDQNSRINDDLPLLMPLGELLASKAEQPLEYIPLLGVDGIIARGTLTLLGAHPKAGKTTLLIHACREWLQQGLRVVYLSEDSHLLWRERVKRFPELDTLLLNTLPRAHPERWVAAIRALEPAPDIVIVDTLRRFLPAQDENDAASVAAALEPFVDLQQWLPRTAIILVHHTKKSLSSDGEITDIAGSHAFTAEVDAILLLTPVREHKRQRVLTPIAGRLWNLAPEPLVLELSEDANEYRVLGTAEEVLPETRKRSAKEAIRDALRVLECATAEEIAEYLRTNGEPIASSHLRNLLTELVQEGAIQRKGEGRRGSPYTYSIYSAGLIPIESRQQNNQQNGTQLEEPDYSAVLIPIGGNTSRINGDAANYSADFVLEEETQQNNNPLPELPLLAQADYSAGLIPPEETQQNNNPADGLPDYSAGLNPIEGSQQNNNPAATAEPLPALLDLLQEPLEEWLARAEQVLDPYAPSFHDRLERAWDAIDDCLQRASMPHDPLGLEPHEVEALRMLLAYAEARGFPALTLPEYGYTIHAGRDGWLNALPDIAGTPAVATATRMLQEWNTAGEPVAPAPTRTNGNAGFTPSQQLSFLEG